MPVDLLQVEVTEDAEQELRPHLFLLLLKFRLRALEERLGNLLGIVQVLENDRRYINQNPKCEPQLGKRGIYRQMGGNVESKEAELAMLWVLNLSDGNYSLLEIAERANLSFERIAEAAAVLCSHGLLKEC